MSLESYTIRLLTGCGAQREFQLRAEDIPTEIEIPLGVGVEHVDDLLLLKLYVGAATRRFMLHARHTDVQSADAPPLYSTLVYREAGTMCNRPPGEPTTIGMDGTWREATPGTPKQFVTQTARHMTLIAKPAELSVRELLEHSQRVGGPKMCVMTTLCGCIIVQRLGREHERIHFPMLRSNSMLMPGASPQALGVVAGKTALKRTFRKLDDMVVESQLDPGFAATATWTVAVHRYVEEWTCTTGEHDWYGAQTGHTGPPASSLPGATPKSWRAGR